MKTKKQKNQAPLTAPTSNKKPNAGDSRPGHGFLGGHLADGGKVNMDVRCLHFGTLGWPDGDTSI